MDRGRRYAFEIVGGCLGEGDFAGRLVMIVFVLNKIFS
jgi:hypothetical protein